MNKPKTIFAGHFGSGKSEIAVNCALREAREGRPAYFIDLDIVKPFFRSRMVRNILLTSGVHMIIPSGEQVYADLPIVLPRVKGIMKEPGTRVFLDVAGDPDGCRVLRSFLDALDPEEVDLMLVVNTSRPRTGDAASNLAMLRSIEAMAGLRVAGVVANTHLMDETTPGIVEEGYARTLEFANGAGLRVEYVVAREDVARRLDPARFACPVLPIETFIRPPFGAKPAGTRWSPIVV